MSDQDEAELRLFNHTDKLLQGHQRLLGDRKRNQAFYRALKGTVTNKSTVLDIGSGTGIWAVTAALLGAKRVVAIEYEPLLIGVINALAEENGVADQIEVILGDSREVRLEKDFDIVISETIGHLVFDESIVSIMIDARERFLKPGGIMIPQTVSLIVAAANFENANEKLPSGIPLVGTVFESLSLNIPLALQDKSNLTILTEPLKLIRTDLETVMEMPFLNDLSTHWEVTDTAKINCFVVWAEATLTDDVSVSTNQTTSWKPMVYRIKPLQHERGELLFSLTLTSKSNYWTVSLTDRQHFEEQSYSPASAAAELLTRSQSYTNALEHLNVTQG